MKRFVATFSLPDDADVNDVADVLAYRLGRLWSIPSGEEGVDPTVFTEEGFAAALRDLP